VYKLDKSAGNGGGISFFDIADELDGIMDRVRDSEGTGTYRVRPIGKQGTAQASFQANGFRGKLLETIQPANDKANYGGCAPGLHQFGE